MLKRGSAKEIRRPEAQVRLSGFFRRVSIMMCFSVVKLDGFPQSAPN